MPHPNPERRHNAPPGSSLLAGLTPEQARAVTHGTGPLLLIAGLVPRSAMGLQPALRSSPSGVDQRYRSRIVLLGGLRWGLRKGSSAGRRWRAGRRSARRRWSRSLMRACSATSSGRPPGGGSGRFGGRSGPPRPSSPASGWEGPGEEKKRSRTAGTSSASAKTRRVNSSGSGSKPPM